MEAMSRQVTVNAKNQIAPTLDTDIHSALRREVTRVQFQAIKNCL